MVRMTVAPVRSPGDEDIRPQPLQFFKDTLSQSEQHRRVRVVMTERPVGESKQNRWVDTERLRRATSFLHAQLGDLRATRNRSIGCALRAIGRNDHMDLDALTCIP